MGRGVFRAAGIALLVMVGSVAARAQAPIVPPVEMEPGVTLEVTELKRMPDKGAMQLKFVIANASQKTTSAKDLGLATGFRLDEIQLIDFAGKRAYNIGSASRCLCSTFSDGGAVSPGGRREFWAWFGLPDVGVKTLSLQISSKPPIGDLPLQ
jgi:hypothetical protein